MIDPLTFIFGLMLASWLIGIVFIVLGIIADAVEGFMIAAMVWMLFSIPLTVIWAILWVLVEALL